MFPFHRYIRLLILSGFFLLPGILYAQPDTRQFTLRWSPLNHIQLDGKDVTVLHFQGASHELNTLLPNFYEILKITNNLEYEVELKNPVFQVIDHEVLGKAAGVNDISNDIEIRQSHATLRKQPYLQVGITPLRRNSRTGQVEALSSFSLELKPKTQDSKSLKAVHSDPVSNSLLASGNWIRIRVDHNGIYRLTYEELLTLGINNPASVRLYGHGGGMLPEYNLAERYDDLQENAIFIDTGGDGSFGTGDYLLFYGRSPHEWRYDPVNSFFQKQIHAYSDGNYYFSIFS